MFTGQSPDHHSQLEIILSERSAYPTSLKQGLVEGKDSHNDIFFFKLIVNSDEILAVMCFFGGCGGCGGCGGAGTVSYFIDSVNSL